MNKTSIIYYQALWERIGAFARSAGHVTTRPVLLLFYVMKSKETPRLDKLLIFPAISCTLYELIVG